MSHLGHVGQPSEQEKCIVGGLKTEQNGCLHSQYIIILLLRRKMVAESVANLTLMHSFVTVNKYLIVDKRKNANRSFRFLRLYACVEQFFFLSRVGLHDINKIYNICC